MISPFESLLGSSLAKAERCCNITFRDAPFFGSFLADEQDQKLSVLKPAVASAPDSTIAVPRSTGDAVMGDLIISAKKGEGAVHPLKVQL
jgi:hypothetical protein